MLYRLSRSLCLLRTQAISQTCPMIRNIEAAVSKAASSHGQRRSRPDWVPPVYWTALGFLAGALFWHFVGFWSFVTRAVFDGDGAPPAAHHSVATTKPAEPLPDLSPTGRRMATSASCVALTIDRSGGPTRMAPCPAATFYHRNAGLGVKRDREATIAIENGQGIAGWATDLQGAPLAVPGQP